MARQRGVIKLDGTLDDVTFYKTGDGYLAKVKSQVSAQRILNDPAFIRTRENMKEFGNAAKSGKYLRNPVHPLTKNAADSRMISRVVKLMSSIQKFDVTSARGDRTVGIGIADPAALALLKGFEFNSRSHVGRLLFKPFTVNTVTGVISITNLVPINDLDFPAGATHVTFSDAWANIDFGTGVSDIQFSLGSNLPIDGTMSSVLLTPSSVPTGTATNVYLLMIEFFELVNGVQYLLNNGIYNALMIADAV